MTVDIEKLKALALASSKGPWRWELSHQNKSVSLTGGRPMFDKTVMDFTRWGMGGAAPRFNDAIASGEYNIMERVEKYGAKVPGREHHANWFMDIAHPDAQWIAAANPAAVLDLIAEVERLRAEFAARCRAEGGDTNIDAGAGLTSKTAETRMDSSFHAGAGVSDPAAGTVKDAELADALNTTLWLYRRLPQAYGKPPFVDKAILTMAARLGMDDVPAAIKERAAIEAHTKAGSGA